MLTSCPRDPRNPRNPRFRFTYIGRSKPWIAWKPWITWTRSFLVVKQTDNASLIIIAAFLERGLEISVLNKQESTTALPRSADVLQISYLKLLA